MHARVKLGETPGDVEIEVGGQRIENGVRSLTIYSSAGSYPEIGLDLAMVEAITAEGQLTVRMASATRDALIALGWTPPPEV